MYGNARLNTSFRAHVVAETGIVDSPSAQAGSGCRPSKSKVTWRRNLRQKSFAHGLGRGCGDGREGGFYGWPHCYWGQNVDTRAQCNPLTIRAGRE